MRFQPQLGCTGLLAVVLLLLPCGGCGGGEDDPNAGAARVRLLTSDADGPFDGVVMLRGMVAGVEREFEARPVSSEPDVYVAPGAPPGMYSVSTSTGWGMLWAGAGRESQPFLRASDFPAASVRLGRPYSLYVGAYDPRTADGPVTSAWGAEWRAGGGGSQDFFEPFEIKVEPQEEGLVALRFGQDVWEAGREIRVGGMFQSGAVTRLITLDLRGDTLGAPPRLALAIVAPRSPLDVHFLPPPGVERVADGRLVRVTLREAPLAATYEAKSFEGRARFEGIGLLGSGLLVEMPDIGPHAQYVLDQGTWQVQGDVHILALEAANLARVQLDVGEALLTEARVRFAGTTSYGLLPLWRAGGKTFLTTAPGAQHWLLRRDDGQWIEHGADIPAAAAGQDLVEKVRGEARTPARVQGNVDGGAERFRVRFTRLLESGERESGAGFCAAVDAFGHYEVSLPAGRYELQVIRPGGRLVRPRVLPRALEPGGEARIDLPAR